MPQEDTANVLTTLTLVGHLGLVMAASVVAGFLLGHYLDEMLGTAPVLTIILLLAGIAGGLVAVYRLVMRNVTPPHSDRDQDQDSIE